MDQKTFLRELNAWLDNAVDQALEELRSTLVGQISTPPRRRAQQRPRPAKPRPRPAPTPENPSPPETDDPDDEEPDDEPAPMSEPDPQPEEEECPTRSTTSRPAESTSATDVEPLFNIEQLRPPLAPAPPVDSSSTSIRRIVIPSEGSVLSTPTVFRPITRAAHTPPPVEPTPLPTPTYSATLIKETFTRNPSGLLEEPEPEPTVAAESESDLDEDLDEQLGDADDLALLEEPPHTSPSTTSPTLVINWTTVQSDSDALNPELPPEPRKRRRRRRMRPRSRTIAVKRITRHELRVGHMLYPIGEFDHIPRPVTRADCEKEPRPCPRVGCKFHLYLDVNPETGSIKLNFPDLEPWELRESCTLDVAERGGITLEEVGEIMNLTRERIRQVEVRGLIKIKMQSPSDEELGAAALRFTDELRLRRRDLALEEDEEKDDARPAHRPVPDHQEVA